MVFKVTNTSGSEIFDMIFATDHWVGEKIMKDVYSAAERRQPALGAERSCSAVRTKKNARDSTVCSTSTSSHHKPEGSIFEVKPQQLPPHPAYRRPGRR